MIRFKLFHILLLASLASCLQPAPTTFSQEEGQNNTPGNSNIATDIGSPTTYFQLSGQTTSGALSMSRDYNDSFLIRGNNVHNYILNYINSTSKRCLIANFETSTQNKVVALSLKVRSTYNVAAESDEYYFQVQPNNYAGNFLECSSVDVSNTINSLYTTSLIAYDISSICSECTLDILSNEVKLIQDNGTQISQIFSPNMRLNIQGNTDPGDGNGGQNQCSEDNSCEINGFDCCLEGQCVNHGRKSFF